MTGGHIVLGTSLKTKGSLSSEEDWCKRKKTNGNREREESYLNPEQLLIY